MARIFICPDCGEQDDHVDAAWEEVESSRCTGVYDPRNGHESNDRDYGNTDSSDYEYSCPKCGNSIHGDVEDFFYIEGSDEFRERIAELIDEGVLDKEDNVCVVVGGSNE
jgi:rubredoxin